MKTGAFHGRIAFGRPVKLAAGLVALSLLTGCRWLNHAAKTAIVPGTTTTSPANLTEAELREKLDAFYIGFVNTVEDSTRMAADRTTDPELKRRLLEGRITTVRRLREVIFQHSAMASFVDTWTFCLQFEHFLNSPEGRERLGEAQPTILDASDQLNEEIVDLGKLFLDKAELDDVQKKLEKFVQEHPYSVQHELVNPSADLSYGIPQLGWLLDMPLSPFRAVQGVDKTAGAINQMATVANGFSETFRDMPRELSWESELFLMQVNEQASDLMAQMDQRQTNLQTTLGQTRQTVEEADKALEQLNTSLISGRNTAEAITQMTKSMTTLSETTAATLKEIHDLYPPKPESATTTPGPPGRPFDILDYARTADEIDATTSNLTQLLVEIRKTVGDDAMSRRMQEGEAAVAQTQTLMRQLVNHVAVLVLLLIIAFFVILTGYRVLSLRMQKKGAPVDGGK